MSGTLWKRSSRRGTYQPRQFELIFYEQTGEVSLQYASLREKTTKAINWAQVRGVHRGPPTAAEFTISLRPSLEDGAVPPDIHLRAADGLALEAWLAGARCPGHAHACLPVPART